ncbi:MAG: nucleotidyltransferase family protein [Tissierellia bacterium]|nr:nucleotidyltransferase family protein [Tissierellia bacterium]
MKNYAIIAEFNPFHNGHKYLIESIKKNEADAKLIILLSGSFVQRGEPAIFDKWFRTKCALENGADLVLELPFSYSCQNSEFFAKGAIKILHELNIVDEIVFGSESGNIYQLYDLSKRISTVYTEFNYLIEEYLNSGFSFIKSRNMALKRSGQFTDSEIELLNSPNDILALEYISAIDYFNSDIKSQSIKRNISKSYKSATKLRKNLYNNKSIKSYLPYKLNPDIYLPDYKSLFDIIKYKYLIVENVKNYRPDDEDGLVNRIRNTLLTTDDFNDFIEKAHHKRITKARLKRLICNQILEHDFDIVYNSFAQKNAYIRVLGFNSDGQKLINQIDSKQNIITKFSNIKKIKDENIKNIALSELKASNLRSILCGEKINRDFLTSPVKQI